MRADYLISWDTLYGFLFALARISAAFAFIPLAAFKATPEPVRVVFALAFTMMLRSEWRAPGGTSGVAGILAGVASEVALGLAIGVALAIVLEVFQIAAQMISLQAGFGFASTIDPTNGADSTVLLTLAQITAALFFFTSGADRLFVRALADSMRLAPPTTFHLQANFGEGMIRFFGLIFGAGLRLAAPIVALLLLADASLAVLGRVQSQIQLVSLTMPIKLGASLLLLSATLGMQIRFFETSMTQFLRFVEAMLRGVR